MLPKSIPKSLKIHSRSHPETNPPKITKIYRTKPLQTLKIELSCMRGASFQKITISKNKKYQNTNNSPGHWPRACQIPGNNPLSWLLFPSGTGLKVSLSSERIRFIVSSGGGLGFRCAGSMMVTRFLGRSKNHSRNRSRFSSIFDAKRLPKSIQKSLKIHSWSHPETNSPKITKLYRT